jgi:hypothetical protein
MSKSIKQGPSGILLALMVIEGFGPISALAEEGKIKTDNTNIRNNFANFFI